MLPAAPPPAHLRSHDPSVGLRPLLFFTPSSSSPLSHLQAGPPSSSPRSAAASSSSLARSRRPTPPEMRWVLPRACRRFIPRSPLDAAGRRPPRCYRPKAMRPQPGAAPFSELVVGPPPSSLRSCHHLCCPSSSNPPTVPPHLLGRRSLHPSMPPPIHSWLPSTCCSSLPRSSAARCPPSIIAAGFFPITGRPPLELLDFPHLLLRREAGHLLLPFTKVGRPSIQAPAGHHLLPILISTALVHDRHLDARCLPSPLHPLCSKSEPPCHRALQSSRRSPRSSGVREFQYNCNNPWHS